MGGLIKTVALVGGASFERGVDEAHLDAYLRDPHNLVWVDVTAPGPDERSFLIDHFAFHPLAIEDSVRGRERPKLDDHGAYLFLVTYGVLPRRDAVAPLELASVGLFVGKNFVVTLHESAMPAVDDALRRFERSGALLAEGAGYLAYLVLDTLVASYAPAVDALGEALDEAERTILLGSAEARIERLLAIRRDVFHLRRFLFPTREAFAPLLRAERPLMTAAVRVYQSDANDHVLRLLDLLDVHREMVAGSLDASLTIVSNRLNMTMKRLTVVSATVGFAGCIFGAWGMNVPGLPGAMYGQGFAVVVGSTLVATAFMLGFGRRKGWL